MKVFDLIHKVSNPYRNAEFLDVEVDLQGWNSESPVFKKLIFENNVKIICEVGTWKGASAIHMAKCLKGAVGQFSILNNAEIVCVDTFLGSLEMWIDPDKYELMNFKHGRSGIYETFLNNILSESLEKFITPFPTTSAIAAKFFKHHKIMFDLIYIDASHDTQDVMDDINNYVDLAPVIFGDDYDWLSVKEGVDKMAKMLPDHNFEVINEKWILRRK